MIAIKHIEPDLATVYQRLAAEMDRLRGAAIDLDGQHALWGPHMLVLNERQRFNTAWETVASDVPGLTRRHKEALWCQWRDNTRGMRRGAA